MLDTDDNFVEFGTPLEPLEEDELVSRKRINIQDQVAVDEAGRRRFHGAFTGGFSAGYYNTVGSKEGWTPSTFKSSRSSKTTSNKIQQNVLDFMDDEDKGAFGIAPQVLRPTSDFSSSLPPPPKNTQNLNSIIPGLEKIIQPIRTTIGVQILARMGWREGQGIGPRISKKVKKKSKKTTKSAEIGQENQNSKAENVAKSKEEHNLKSFDKKSTSKSSYNSEEIEKIGDVEVDNRSKNSEKGEKVYSCFIPDEFRKISSEKLTDKKSESEISDDSLNNYENIKFAPDDVENPICRPKENSFGLGYSGLDRNALSFGAIDLFGTSSSSIKSRVENRKLNISGEAFGIGAFEDADEEVYSKSDLSQYDFSLETPEERRLKRKNEKLLKEAKNKAKNGSSAIAGFCLAKNPVLGYKIYPPPHLPSSFVPQHNVKKSRFEPIVPPKNEEKKRKERHGLSISEREALLGDEKIPLTPQEQLEIENCEKLEKERQEKLALEERGERLKKFTQVLQLAQNSTSENVNVVNSFKPFMKNPAKQERYEKYLALLKAGFQECLKDLQPVEMTEWEKEREKNEFIRASELYRPIPNIMSSRFVSAQSHDISHLVPAKEAELKKDPTEDPLVAAKMNLFGKLTHRNYEWHPDRVLSKRFNVPHPHPDSKMIGIRHYDNSKTSKSKTKAENEVNSNEEAKKDENSTSSLVVAVPKKSLFENIDFSKPPPGLLPLEDSKKGGENSLEFEKNLKNQEKIEKLKPSIDLFREIFEDTDSESENEVNLQNNDKNSDIQESDRLSAENYISPDKSAQNINLAKKSSDIFNLAQKSSKNSDSSQKSSQISSNFQKNQEKEVHKSIFENLDLDKMQNLPQSSQFFQNNKIIQVKTEKNSSEDEEEEDLYGPKLIPSKNTSILSTDLKNRHVFTKNRKISQDAIKNSESSEEEDEWVDVNEIKKSRKRKSSKNKAKKDKKSKHKHKKSKSSKSKSKKSKKKSSSSDTSESLTSDDDELIKIHSSLNSKKLIERLKKITKYK